MGTILKVCVMCGKRKPIGKSKARCKECRAILSKNSLPPKPASSGGKRRPKRPCNKPFKGNYSDYMRSSRWKRKRQRAFEHHGEKCNRCGCTTIYLLQVHHRHYRTLFNERMDDLEILCDGCHKNEHEGKVRGVYDPMTKEYLKIMKSL